MITWLPVVDVDMSKQLHVKANFVIESKCKCFLRLPRRLREYFNFVMKSAVTKYRRIFFAKFLFRRHWAVQEKYKELRIYTSFNRKLNEFEKASLSLLDRDIAALSNSGVAICFFETYCILGK